MAGMGSSGPTCTEVALLLAELVETALRRAMSGSPSQVREACRQVAQVRPSMGEMIRLGNDAGLCLTELAGLAGLAAWCRGYTDRREAMEARMVGHLVATISGPVQVATLSNSSAVRSTLLALHAARRLKGAWCAVSDPSGEGRVLARGLVQQGVTVHLLPDAAMETAVREADLVLCGADALQGLGVVNRVGTGLLALAALQHSRPVHVLSTSLKLLPPSLQRLFAFDAGGADELLGAGQARKMIEVGGDAGVFDVLNPYRERVVYDLITSVFTEQGEVATSALPDLARAVPVATGLGF